MLPNAQGNPTWVGPYIHSRKPNGNRVGKEGHGCHRCPFRSWTWRDIDWRKGDHPCLYEVYYYSVGFFQRRICPRSHGDWNRRNPPLVCLQYQWCVEAGLAEPQRSFRLQPLFPLTALAFHPSLCFSCSASQLFSLICSRTYFLTISRRYVCRTGLQFLLSEHSPKCNLINKGRWSIKAARFKDL